MCFALSLSVFLSLFSESLSDLIFSCFCGIRLLFAVQLFKFQRFNKTACMMVSLIASIWLSVLNRIIKPSFLMMFSRLVIVHNFFRVITHIINKLFQVMDYRKSTYVFHLQSSSSKYALYRFLKGIACRVIRSRVFALYTARRLLLESSRIGENDSASAWSEAVNSCIIIPESPSSS